MCNRLRIPIGVISAMHVRVTTYLSEFRSILSFYLRIYPDLSLSFPKVLSNNKENINEYQNAEIIAKIMVP